MNDKTDELVIESDESGLDNFLQVTSLGLANGCDFTNHAVYVTGVVTPESVAHYIRTIESFCDSGAQQITLIINSPGGCAYSGLAMYDYLAKMRASIPIVGIVMGACMSSASIILQGCTYRAITPSSKIMIHEAKMLTGGYQTHGEAIIDATETQVLNKAMAGIYETESCSKKPKNLAKSWLDLLVNGDRYLSAEMSVSLGLCDAVEYKYTKRKKVNVQKKCKK